MGNQEWALRVDVHQLRGRQRLVSLCNAERDSHAGQQHLELHEYSSQTDDENSDQVKCEVWIIAVILACVSFIGYVAVKYLGASRGDICSRAAGGLVSSTAVTVAQSPARLLSGSGSRFSHHRDGELPIDNLSLNGAAYAIFAAVASDTVSKVAIGAVIGRDVSRHRWDHEPFACPLPQPSWG